ncbi:hypothetical protein PAHAL_9G108900 [Panicum hallii]|uniref:Chromatin-remodeling complex ATPase n=1 Tax=Panicum hallii TaxID=206008 RepID=A0A2S3IIK9_9POAL|nr:hypothetical protein PAHAL_9G108900 [Panicum hallii]
MVEGMVVAVPNGVKAEVAPAAATADSPKSVLEEEKISDPKNGNASLATEPTKQEESSDDFVDASSSLPVDLEIDSASKHPVKEEEQLLEPVKEEEVDGFVDESLSMPIDLEAKNGDASMITEAMKKEEEQLEEVRIKAEEEEEARKREEATRLAFDPEAKYSKLDELLTKTQLFSEFLLQKMDQIADQEVVEPQAEEPPAEEKKKGRGRKRKAKAVPQYNDKKAKTAVAAMLTRSREERLADDCTLSEEERWKKEQANLVPLMTGGNLKSYQIKGVKWLISLWQNGLNGILADQMGLGKTIQTIGFLAHLKGKGTHGPYMIIAPLSTLSNWVNEISRFVPSVTSIIYHGDKVARAEIRRKFMPKTKDAVSPDFPIVVTSYEMAMSDARFLAHYKWKYVVVDEGHRLKNSKCKLLREIKRIPMDNKLLLTGTPLQNNLAELWSLLNFILPDIFSSHEEFESWFDFSGKASEEKEETEEKRRVHVVSKLHAILRPFLLRRMKEDVEQMLPRKKEIIIYANMTELQKRIQDHLVEKTFDVYLNEESDIVLRRPGIKAKLNSLFIQLRKNCSHPDLLEAAFGTTILYPPVDKLLEQCGKFQLLDRLLTSLLARKHKVLIFSQWTKILDIIEYYLDSKGLEVCRIDGSVSLEERRRQIAEFNDLNSNLNVFILSTRAGGLGINLTSADTCILYDSDWNPQMDLQAMDRCHRIGQTRPVHVYRLATSHSVEGRIIKKAFGKLKLEHVVIGKGQFEQERAKPNVLEEGELLALLRDEQAEEDKMIQTDISDEDLLKLMDRSDLSGPPGAVDAAPLIPLKGPGWEVVVPTKSGGGMLSSLTS